MRLTVFFFVKFKSFKYEKLYFKYSGNAIIFYISVVANGDTYSRMFLKR